MSNLRGALQDFEQQGYVEVAKGKDSIEIVTSREEIYRKATEAAKSSDLLNPIRSIKIYAPLGFADLRDDKREWLETVKKLVIGGQVKEVEAIYGFQQSKAGLAKVANFLTYFFYHADSGKESEILRKRVTVKGIPLGGQGLGIPAGFGILIIESKMLLIAYAPFKGDKLPQQAIIIRNEKAILEMSDWFSNHTYRASESPNRICGFEFLQGISPSGEHITLVDTLPKILIEQGISQETVEKILKPTVLTWDELKSLGIYD